MINKPNKHLSKRLLLSSILFASFTFVSMANAIEPITDYRQKTSLEERINQAQKLIDTDFGHHTDIVKATKILTAVIKQDRTYAPAYVQMAKVVLASRDQIEEKHQQKILETAGEFVNTAIDLDPDYAETYVQAVRLHILSGNYELALATVNKAKLLGSTNPWLESYVAKIHYATSRYSEADNAYQLISDKGRGNTAMQYKVYMTAVTQQMNIAYLTSNLERMQALATKLVESANPQDAKPWANAGGVLCREGLYDKGIEYTQNSIAILKGKHAQKNLALCHYGKWAELRSKGNVKVAEQHFSTAYALNSDLVQVINAFSTSGKALRELTPLLKNRLKKLSKDEWKSHIKV